MIKYLELLAVLAQLITASLVIVWLLSLVSGFGKSALAWVRGVLDDIGVYFAAAVAVVTMSGSLYLSEHLLYKPCVMCWYQRCAAYPLAVMLVVASIRKIVKRDGSTVRPYALAVAFVGMCVSAYHICIEIWPTIEGITKCDPDNLCSLRYIDNDFGFLTIPRMAFTAFITIITVLLLTPSQRETN